MKIPNELNKFDQLIINPFCIFEKKNFLDENLYQSLNENFPDENMLNKTHTQGKKIFLNNKQKEFFNFIEKNSVWKNFYNKFNNKKMIIFLINLISKELKKIHKRKDLKKIKFLENYKDNLFNKIRIKIYKLFNYNILRLGFEFSIIKRNCFIPPHCDTENKLLSLMIYFPPKVNNCKEDISNLGTNFYIKKKNSKNHLDLWESKYLSEKDTKTFYENYKLFYKSLFEKNKLIGFIKNEKSWHDLNKFDFDFNRRSLNINIFLV